MTDAATEPVSTERIDVLFCANPGYFQHLAVAAVSLAATSRHPSLVIHVLASCADPAAEAMLRSALRPFANVALIIRHLDDLPAIRRQRLPATNPEFYLRLLVEDILDPGIDRIVYLDCDLVLCAPVEELFACDLGGKVLAAVPDFGDFAGPESRFRSLGLRLGHVYVNSGVMVINLRLWRSEGISDLLFEYLSGRPFEPAHKDQDALNAVLQDRIALVDWRWNLQSVWFTSWAHKAHPGAYAAAAAARARPGILHYTGPDKPWTFRSGASNRSAYFRYLALTPWKDAVPMPGRAERLEYVLCVRLLTLGIDPRAIVDLPRKIRRALTRGWRAMPRCQSCD